MTKNSQIVPARESSQMTRARPLRAIIHSSAFVMRFKCQEILVEPTLVSILALGLSEQQAQTIETPRWRPPLKNDRDHDRHRHFMKHPADQPGHENDQDENYPKKGSSRAR